MLAVIIRGRRINTTIQHRRQRPATPSTPIVGALMRRELIVAADDEGWGVCDRDHVFENETPFQTREEARAFLLGIRTCQRRYTVLKYADCRPWKDYPTAVPETPETPAAPSWSRPLPPPALSYPRRLWDAKCRIRCVRTARRCVAYAQASYGGRRWLSAPSPEVWDCINYVHRRNIPQWSAVACRIITVA